MPKFTALIVHFRPAHTLLFLASLFVIGLTFGLLILKPTTPPFLPLFFSRPWGPDRLVTPLTLYLVPILAFAFLVINHYLANIFRANNLALSKILIWSAFLSSIISLIAVHKILLLV